MDHAKHEFNSMPALAGSLLLSASLAENVQ